MQKIWPSAHVEIHVPFLTLSSEMSLPEFSTNDDGHSTPSGANSSNYVMIPSDMTDEASNAARSVAATIGSVDHEDFQLSPIMEGAGNLTNTPDRTLPRKRPSTATEFSPEVLGEIKRKRSSIEGARVCSLASHHETYLRSSSLERSDVAQEEVYHSPPITPGFPLSPINGDVSVANRSHASTIRPEEGHDARLVPQAIYKLIPEVEKKKIHHFMSERGYEWPNWSKSVFAKYYVSKGYHETLLQYAMTILQAEQVESLAQKAQEKRNKGYDSYDKLNEEEVRGQHSERGLDKIMQKRRSLLQSNNWGRADLETDEPDVDLRSIFPEITTKLGKELVDSVEQFPAKEKCPEKSDYLVWIDRIRSDLRIHSTAQGNYVLLRRVGSVYADKIIRTYAHSIRKIPTNVLAYKVGANVYRMQLRDPVNIANNLRLGLYGCTNERELFSRVVDLHYCRGAGASNTEFVLDATVCIAMHITSQNGLREAWFQELRRTYPTVGLKMQDTDGDSISTQWGSCKLACAYGGKPFPNSSKDIREYFDHLVTIACLQNSSQLSRRWKSRMLMAEDDLEVKELKGFKKKSLTVDVKKATTQVKPNPKEGEKSASKKEPLSAEKKEDWKKKRETRKNRICTTCQKKGHSEQFCYVTFPNLREEHAQRRKDWKEKKTLESATKIIAANEAKERTMAPTTEGFQ